MDIMNRAMPNNHGIWRTSPSIDSVSCPMLPCRNVSPIQAVNGYFFIPNYPTVVAAINFDRTGTTKIGKYVLNHSFMMPGLVSTVVAIALGLLFIQIF